MNTKLIFLDIDGTLLPFGGSVHQPVIDGLTRLRENGHKAFISTGRALTAIPKAVKDAVPVDGYICSAGSDIWLDGKNIYRAETDSERLLRVYDLLENSGSFSLFEGYDHVYLSQNSAAYLSGEKPLPDESMRAWLELLHTLGSVNNISREQLGQLAIPKLLFAVYGDELWEEIRPKLEKDFYISMFIQGQGEFHPGELISHTVNKATAIERVAAYFDADLSDTIAFGDSLNDYPMVQRAGRGVAMGNAAPALKEIADSICESVEDDGVVHELNRLGLL